VGHLFTCSHQCAYLLYVAYQLSGVSAITGSADMTNGRSGSCQALAPTCCPAPGCRLVVGVARGLYTSEAMACVVLRALSITSNSLLLELSQGASSTPVAASGLASPAASASGSDSGSAGSGDATSGRPKRVLPGCALAQLETSAQVQHQVPTR